jgi:hypothetical protein
MLSRLRLCPCLSLSVSSHPSKEHLKKRYKTWYVFWWGSPVFVKTKNEHTHMSISILLSPHHQPKIEPVPTYAPRACSSAHFHLLRSPKPISNRHHKYRMSSGGYAASKEKNARSIHVALPKI